MIKSHGNAEKEAFGLAINVAILEVEKKLPEKIQGQLTQLGNTTSL